MLLATKDQNSILNTPGRLLKHIKKIFSELTERKSETDTDAASDGTGIEPSRRRGIRKRKVRGNDRSPERNMFESPLCLASPWSWKADCSAKTRSAPWSHVTTRSPGHAHFRGRAGGASAGPAAERPSPTGPRGPCTVSVPGDSQINDVLGGTQVPTTASSGPQVQGVRAGEAGGPRPRSSAFPLHRARPSVRMTPCGRTEPLPALGPVTAQPQPRGQRSAPPPRWDALQIG